jgi:hypothetical protein
VRTVFLWLVMTFGVFAEGVAARASSGAFVVTQSYAEDAEAGGGWAEVLAFKKPLVDPIRLTGYPWPGGYSIAPDESWMLRIQKVGSGENIAILYRIEPNGRVSEIVDFNRSLQAAALGRGGHNAVDAFHAGVEGPRWSEDSKTLTLVFTCGLEGKPAAVREEVAYHLPLHSFTISKTKDSAKR